MDDGVFTEIEELRKQNLRLEQDIERLLGHDQQTGLMTRSAFISQVYLALADTQSAASRAVIIEFGIRGLTRITGTLGRHVGDYVISAIAARLNAIMTGDRLCCRLDYQSFAAFIPNMTDALEALKTAKSIMMSLAQPIDWIDRKLSIEVGAGVALCNQGENDAAVLLQHASFALKAATEKGGPGYAFFNPTLAQAAKRKNDVQSALQDALDRQLFDLYYQPYFQAVTGELAGFEALMRLNHPEFGVISPMEFIPVAEATGIINRIGAWVLAEACRTAATWPQHLNVSVNFSPEQFLSGTLLTDIHNALELTSFAAYRLEIEITESTMLGDTEIIMSQINALREMGCSIVLDDFGTGYSSLSYLWKFPFSKIKIDRSFVQAMDEKPKVRGMLGSIIDLARNLGLKVTAEGIETKSHAETLKKFKCDYFQGYLCGKPLPASELAAVIMTRFAANLRDMAAVSAPAPASNPADLKFEF